MKRIILSLLTLGIVAVVATGATTALLSDEEISSGNTFTAGAVDLGVDNHSYYNGYLCQLTDEGYIWLTPGGRGAQPEPADQGYPYGLPCESSWEVDYDIEHNEQGETEVRRFFAFDDLKPGDWGEDTISLHVDNNDAYLCVDVTLTSDDDNGCTEPEAGDGDLTCGEPGLGEGELADAITFFWWADDGDNVYEESETLLPAGPLGALGVGETATIALADSQQNIWNTDLLPGPVPGGETLYIGKAWCFGDGSGFAAYAEGDTGPDVRPVQCDGAPLNNETQTDSATLDISFQAVQARHNSDFFCIPQEQETTLTVEKIVVNDDGGQETVGSWTLNVSPDVGDVTSGVANVITPGGYNVTETGPAGYALTYGGDCDANGNVTVAEFEQATCTLTNDDDDVASLTIDKSISLSEPGLIASVDDFNLFIDDGNGQIQVFDQVTASGLVPGAYTITEVYTGSENIIFDAVFGGACTDDGQTGSVTLAADDNLDCTLINLITEGPV